MSAVEVLYEGHFLRVCRRGRWEYVERSNATGAVVIVAVTDDDRVLLTEQVRPPVDAPVLELPAGLIGDQPGEENYREAAVRELEEETGFRAADISLLTDGPSAAGLSNEQVVLVRASGLKRVGPGGGDDTEDIQVHEIPRDEVGDWLAQRRAQGTLIDPKVYAGLYFLFRDA